MRGCRGAGGSGTGDGDVEVGKLSQGDHRKMLSWCKG
jgi:hypothetical protein